MTIRLLNVHTLELRKFTGLIPVYTILSHTWEDEEVTLQEIINIGPATRRKKGFKKISDFCMETAAWRIDWGWVDTCCIDKTDVGELSQALNSMFAWYRDSAVCLVYLSDFHLRRHGDEWNHEELGRSRWFTRGWTLQELIAPEHLVFHDSRWRVIGTKKILANLVSKITGISASLLQALKTLRDFSCAQKMSWAAYRQTTQVEDRAYSLLGLFNISFPLVYGEGWKAFGRLQEEILKVSTDQSIFAWTQNGLDPAESVRSSRHENSSLTHQCSILAPTPDCFYDSASIIRAPTDSDRTVTHPLLAQHLSGYSGPSYQFLNRPIVLVNTGLQMSLLVQKLTQVHGEQWLLEAMLNCCYDDDRKRKITIFLVADFGGLDLHSLDGNVAAWRVEPYYIGTSAWIGASAKELRREKRSGQPMPAWKDETWGVVPLCIHPVHCVWPKPLVEQCTTKTTGRQHSDAQRIEGQKRIHLVKRRARMQAIKAQTENSLVSRRTLKYVGGPVLLATLLSVM